MRLYPWGHVSSASHERGLTSICCDVSRSCKAFANKCTASYMSAVSVCWETKDKIDGVSLRGKFDSDTFDIDKGFSCDICNNNVSISYTPPHYVYVRTETETLLEGVVINQISVSKISFSFYFSQSKFYITFHSTKHNILLIMQMSLNLPIAYLYKCHIFL